MRINLCWNHFNLNFSWPTCTTLTWGQCLITLKLCVVKCCLRLMIASLCRYGTGCFLLYNTGREVLQGLTHNMIFLKKFMKIYCLLSLKRHIYISFKILGPLINQVLWETDQVYPQCIDLRYWLIFFITEGSGFTEWSANNSSLQTRTWPASGVCLRGKLGQLLITACV